MLQKLKKRNFLLYLCLLMLVITAAVVGANYYSQWKDTQKLEQQQERLNAMKAEGLAAKPPEMTKPEQDDGILSGIPELRKAEVLDEYRAIYAENPDFIGWLSIDGTVIDYPVMQTIQNEEYYLFLDFTKENNKNGSLIMDTDSVVGVGTKDLDYITQDEDGIVKAQAPSTNMIIHGHTMKSGNMFGDLDLYQKEDYGKEHNVICFDSLYEHREYELIAVFFTRVFYEDQNVFKYYKFFQANTQAEFDYWYENIKKMSLYDTGVTAQFGDEFITLSSCAYHVENGRFVVVGKRVK